jgi:hypothetical protein
MARWIAGAFILRVERSLRVTVVVVAVLRLTYTVLLLLVVRLTTMMTVAAVVVVVVVVVAVVVVVLMLVRGHIVVARLSPAFRHARVQIVLVRVRLLHPPVRRVGILHVRRARLLVT